MTGWLRKAQENEDGTLAVTGIASDASEPDCDGEILDIDRSWPSLEKRMEGCAVGAANLFWLCAFSTTSDRRAIARRLCRSGEQVWAEAVVDDPTAIRLVKSGTLSQLSFGATTSTRKTSGTAWSASPSSRWNYPLSISLAFRARS